jgi:hypothetical protein
MTRPPTEAAYFRLILAAPAFGSPLLGIVYLLCQVAVLLSDSEKQRFELVVSRVFRTFGWLSGARPWLTR